MTARNGIVVFSGGSAANSLVDIFNNVAEARKCQLSYIIPISDNGGSSSEIIRVFGGPGIGDIRSRLIRLIPDTPSHAPLRALLSHRLPPASRAAHAEWLSIVDATHPLWLPLSAGRRELLRSFLNLVNAEAVRRARPPGSVFDFASASVGNLFLTGARLFTGDLEAAVELLATLGGVPGGAQVVPAVSSNFTHHIAASLADGSVVVGQNAISHPSVPTSVPDPLSQAAAVAVAAAHAHDHQPQSPQHDAVEDATLPGALPALRGPHIAFSKDAADADAPLPAPIARVWYVSPYGHEIRLAANPRAVAALRAAHAVVYSVGSLYTSIAPSLVLRGVGAALLPDAAASGPAPLPPVAKVLVLNGTVDRETGPPDAALSATGFVRAVAAACCAGLGPGAPAAPEPREYRRFVTHVLYMDGPAAPRTDREELRALGIECLKVGGGRRGRYDPGALEMALLAVIGFGGGGGPGASGPGGGAAGKSRRNTVVDG